MKVGNMAVESSRRQQSLMLSLVYWDLKAGL